VEVMMLMLEGMMVLIIETIHGISLHP